MSLPGKNLHFPSRPSCFLPEALGLGRFLFSLFVSVFIKYESDHSLALSINDSLMLLSFDWCGSCCWQLKPFLPCRCCWCWCLFTLANTQVVLTMFFNVLIVCKITNFYKCSNVMVFYIDESSLTLSHLLSSALGPRGKFKVLNAEEFQGVTSGMISVT